MKQEFAIDSKEVIETAQRVFLFTFERLCFDPERYLSHAELAQNIVQPHIRDSEPCRSFNQIYGALASPSSNVETMMNKLYEKGKLNRIKKTMCHHTLKGVV